MITETDALAHLDTALAALKRAGASDADAAYVGGDSASVSVRLGAVEEISRSEDAEIGMRAFVGDRSASVALSDFAPAAIEEAAARAVAMARLATSDEHAGLAPQDMLIKTALPDLETDDRGDIDLAGLEVSALQCEDAARAVRGITNSGGGGASASRGTFALATSHGFAAARTGTSYSVYASVIAGEGDDMQRDYASHSARHLADLEDVSEVGSRAGTRTTGRLNPVKPKSGTMPVLFDPRVSPGIVGHLIGAINGAGIARGTSFLTEPGAQVFGPGIAILEDPHRLRGHRSRAFDGEGIATTKRSIVEDGHLTGWLLNNAAAHQLGLVTTGHASRGTGGPPGIGPSNLHMAAGTQSREDMIAGITSGVLITELIGQGVSIVTGDYSRGAGGFLIENGEITSPVSGITIAGNLKDMFARLTPASDLEFRHATNAPTLLVEGMTVAGE